MARTPDHDYQGNAGTPSGQGSSIETIDAQSSTDMIELPNNGFVADAEMTRDGQDLILEAPDGSVLVVEGYFSVDPAPTLQSPDGSVLTPQLVDSFAQHPAQYASTESQSDASPVGSIQEVTGEATVTRVDGTVEPITMGTPIYQGDIVETEGDGAVNITFIDDTSFAVSENARLAIDEYVYDPATESGTSNFSVLRGVFVFTSGLIGRDDPDDVEIETPVGSIGIRGTIIAGNIVPGGESEITVVEGAIVVRNGINEKTLSLQFESVKLQGFNDSIESIGVLDAVDVGNKFDAVSDVAPTLFSAINDAANDQNNNDTKGPADIEGKESGEAGETGDKPSDANAEQGAEVAPEQQGEPTPEQLTQENLQDMQKQGPTLEGEGLLLDTQLAAEMFGPRGLNGPKPLAHQHGEGELRLNLDQRLNGDEPLADGNNGPNNDVGQNIPNAPIIINTDINDAPNLSSASIRVFNNGIINQESKGIAIADATVFDADPTQSLNGLHNLVGLAFNGVPLSANDLGKFELVKDFDGSFSNQHKYILKLKQGVSLSELSVTISGPTSVDMEVADRNGNGISTGQVNIGPPVDTGNVLHVDQLSGENGFVIRSQIFTGGNEFGISMDTGDFNNDGVLDYLIGTPGESGGGTSYILFGDPASMLNRHEVRIISGQNGQQVGGNLDIQGISVTSVGDMNSDGIDDFLIGNPQRVQGGGNIFGGTATFYAGGGGGAPNNITHSSGPGGAGGTFAANTDKMGSTVLGLGDINNDGFNDFAVTSKDSAEIHVFYGNGSALPVNLNSNNFSSSGSNGFVITTFDGNGTPDLTGFKMDTIGDFNNDGIDDFIVSAAKFNFSGASNNGLNEGGAFILFGQKGNFNDVSDSTENTLTLDNTPTANFMSLSTAAASTNDKIDVAGLGDFDGDGIADVAIADNQAGVSGEIFITFGGGATGNESVAAANQTVSGMRIIHSGSADIGKAISSAGDFNGDGLDDIAISDEANGKVYIVYGDSTPPSTLDLAAGLNASQGLEINLKEGSNVNGPVGRITLESAGDVNGDGFDDLMIGTPDQGILGSGSVFVVHGGDYSDTVTFSSAGTVTAAIPNEDLVGSHGADILSDGSQTGVSFRGGAGNDTILIDNNAFEDINGGSGDFDSVVFSGGGSIDFTNVGAEKITGIEKLEFGGVGQTIRLDVQNIFDLLKSSDTGILEINDNGLAGTTLEIQNGTSSIGISTGAFQAELASLGQNVSAANIGGGFVTYDIGNYSLKLSDTLFVPNQNVDFVV